MVLTRRRLGIVALVLALSCALLGVESLVARKVIFARFTTLEQDDGMRSVTQMLKALEADLTQLAISTHDYAAWDDAYNFLATREPRFVESNFAVETLDNMHVDLVWIVDGKDRDVVALERERSAAEPAAITPEVMQALRAELPNLRAAVKAPALTRLLPTPRGLLAFGAHPVLPTGGRGRARGLMVFARYVNNSVVQRVHETSQLPVELYSSEKARATLPAQARALWNAQRTESSQLLLAPNDQFLNGYVLIRDVHGKPAAILATQVSRDLLAFGRETTSLLMLLFVIIVGLFALVVAGLLLYLEKTGHDRVISERRYRAVITQARETMLLVDTESRQILEANPAAAETLGFPIAELLSMQIDDLFFACDGDVLDPNKAQGPIATGTDRILIVRNQAGEFIDVEVTASALLIDERPVISFVLRDVSARKRAERQLVHNQDRLTHLAHHDALTGLLNRLGLERALPDVIIDAQVAKRHVAFLYLDVDHFKKINDLRGHPVGDKLLQIAADRLRSSVAEKDLIVRMGGDEFVVVSSDLRESIDAAAIAARVRENFATPFDVNGERMEVTCSVGVSVFPNDGADYEILLRNADIALYQSKENGRDCYTLFTNSMVSRVSARIAIEQDLRAAIRDGQFYIEYQPLIDLQTQRIGSLEALVRWHHPIRGRVPPLEFIEIAEKAGLIADIGEFVLRRACLQLAEWKAGGAELVPVAVNVSSKQFERQNLMDLVESAVRASGIDAHLLHLELTESAFMEGHEQHVPLLRALREKGIEISVDDFGTGYSSLAYLKNLPIDCLKIDRAFVRDIDVGNGEAIVEAIVRMAQSLGLTTVAEGVETPSQMRRLRELGATYAQGYYFSKPLAADLCGQLLKRDGGKHLPADTFIGTIGALNSPLNGPIAGPRSNAA